jgi:hypothetical protein
MDSFNQLLSLVVQNKAGSKVINGRYLISYIGLEIYTPNLIDIFQKTISNYL